MTTAKHTCTHEYTSMSQLGVVQHSVCKCVQMPRRSFQVCGVFMVNGILTSNTNEIFETTCAGGMKSHALTTVPVSDSCTLFKLPLGGTLPYTTMGEGDYIHS